MAYRIKCPIEGYLRLDETAQTVIGSKEWKQVSGIPINKK
jgi:hypothetical protein